MPLIQALTMTMTAAMIEQTVPSVPAVPVIMPSVTVMPICSTPGNPFVLKMAYWYFTHYDRILVNGSDKR